MKVRDKVFWDCPQCGYVNEFSCLTIYQRCKGCDGFSATFRREDTTTNHPALVPEIALEVSRLQWAWGDEQMWVCESGGNCDMKCASKEAHTHNIGCTVTCSFFGGSKCIPVQPAPSPWRKARMRWGPEMAQVDKDGRFTSDIEIQMEGE